MPLGPLRTPSPRSWPILALVCLLFVAPAWAEEGTTIKPPPLEIGTHPITADCVVDGDTIKIAKGMPSVRVLGVDTEEVFRKERDREAAAHDFAAYAKAKRGTHAKPVKYGTPAGDAARTFAKALITDGMKVRLERDAVGGRALGTYGRILAHVILVTPTAEINFSEAIIRAGHSPYFVKYGRSLRFDALYRKAEKDAREAKRGVWGKDGPDHYPDYEERLRWWHARADQVDRWRAVAAKPNHVTLGAADAAAKLKALVGKEAVLFGLFDRELKVSSGDRRLLLLSHLKGRGLPLVFFDTKVLDGVDMPAFTSRYVTVRGKVTLYKERPQVVIESATQISTK